MSDTNPKEASLITAAANAAVMDGVLDFSDRQSFEDAGRGFIATIDPITITRESDGKTTYDLEAVKFLEGEAPATANPSLWRMAQLNGLNHGLFEVVPGIYQVRSFDIANMTLIKGETGWIVIDPLTSSESSAAALALANRELGERPVKAIIITHSHADHFAGTLGVVDPADVASGKIPLVTPVGFTQESLSENVLAGPVMQRRATYMYGNLLKPDPKAFLTTGLGAALSMGTTGFVPPNDEICETGETRVLDGIEIEFQMTPGTEAPAEMVFYFPQFKALCMSEITSHHMHNVYTPRGAQVRDALAWSAQINESIDLFGDRLEVEFASHHWPIWGRERAVDYLKKQRDLYKYVHDQSLRLANLGYNKEEVAEQLELPASLAKEFYNRDYYGALAANAKAVYVKYLGHFDGNPANLFPHPPTAAGARYVKFMGGADNVIAQARQSFDEGDYRWVAEVLNHVIMADETNSEAKLLAADALEQLGYQAESGPWRNFYLCGALELRHGVPEGRPLQVSEGMAAGMPLENLFQAMAVRLNGPKADGKTFAFNFEFTDTKESYELTLENCVLNYFPGRSNPSPTATLKLATLDFKLLMLQVRDAATLMGEGKLEIEGEALAFAELAGFFDKFNPRWPIVTPRPAWS
ncbi:alkyl sulfatase dimerization domain-containing protein [Pyruvatibacter sp.]|uniref:alkyl/aryl-sulfatase n=1 Tax=Pyruvatibacter sp. TaxID=1981328 RepID=UPI003267E1F6